jgi:hypothetical protein
MMTPRSLWWPVAACIIFSAGIFTGQTLPPFIVQPPKPEPVIVHPQPKPKPKTAQISKAPSVPKNAIPDTSTDSQILELFLPDDTQLASMHHQASLDAQIEHIMAMSYVLVNCHQMQDAEYNQTYNKILRYLAQQKSDVPAEQRASEAAKRAIASYTLIYRHVDCNDPALPRINEKLAFWRK